ncbi:unnamed protein product [Pylaiella littoralis]
MSPALNPRRSWGARSLGSSGDAIPTTPTSIAEHPARLHKPSKYATPTQLACPPRSRYVWSGETATASRSPSFEGDSLAERHRHCGGGGGDYGGTNGALPGWSRGGSREQQQREYQQIGFPHETQRSRNSSFKAAVLDGEASDGETGWTSPGSIQQSGHHRTSRTKQQQQQRQNNNSSNLDPSSSGSARCPGGRANLFFAADYASSNKAGTDQASSKQPVAGLVEPKPTGLLGVGGSSDSVASEGVAAKARRFLDGRRSREAGARAGPQREVSELQDLSSLDPTSSGAYRASARKDEAPPGLDPLKSATAVDGVCGSGMSSPRQHQHDRQGLDDRDEDSNVRVAFPPHFDDDRKSRSRSASEDGGNEKSRDSLGTKSGSTSLLSIMSGSPRSLGTAHDSATGSSPRTPLSDHSSTDGGNAAAAVAAGSRRGSGSSRTQEVLPAVSSGDREDSDDMDLPSAHPTPLSAFGGGDTSLPSDHPTPKTTRAPGGRSRSRSRSGSRASASGANDGDGKAPAGGSGGDKSTNNPSSFLARLKYWGGARANGKNDTAKEATPIAATRAGRAAAQSSAVSPRKPPEFLAPSTEQRALSGISSSSSSGSRRMSNGNSSHGRGPERRSEGGGSRGVGRQASIPESESPPPYSESAASEAGGISPCELRGCPVMPFDSVTSESMSAHGAAEPPPPYRPGGVRGSAGTASPGTRPSGPSPPYAAALQISRSGSTSSSSSSSRHRNTAEERTRLSAPAAPTYSNFGASHRAELAALRRARGSVPPESNEEEADGEDKESGMGWGANSDADSEDEEEKTELPGPISPLLPKSSTADAAVAAAGSAEDAAVAAEEAEDAAVAAAAAVAALKSAPRPPLQFFATNSTTFASNKMDGGVEALPRQMQQLRQTPRQEVTPPRYMAIVEAASVGSALDTSSTSEQDTSPSEDDGGMMAEILTDRLMEVCQKMEQVASMPSDELSDGGGGVGDATSALGAVHKRRPSGRRRQMSNVSSRGLHSSSGLEEKDGDSDEGSVVDAGAAARKLRRERMRKRSKSRQLATALTVPRDSKGDVIQLHTAAYNGDSDALSAYISQGGDFEVRDHYQATALMLCTERGHTEMVKALLSAGAEIGCVDENGNSALHLACFYGRMDAVELLLAVEADVAAVDSEGRRPLDLATDPAIRRLVRTEEMVRSSAQTFDLLGAVESNDTIALANFIGIGQEACGFPHKHNAISAAAQRLRLDRMGRGNMTAVHLAAFHGYGDVLRMLLEAGAEPNAVCDDGETPLHTACTGGSTLCATLLLEHGANPLATDANGLVPCEKHIAGGRQEMKRLLEEKAFLATPANLLALRADLAEVALQIDAEEDLFVRKGVAIKYLRRALKKKDADIGRLRQTVDARDIDIRNLGDRMESVHQLLRGVSV